MANPFITNGDRLRCGLPDAETKPHKFPSNRGKTGNFSLQHPEAIPHVESICYIHDTASINRELVAVTGNCFGQTGKRRGLLELEDVVEIMSRWFDKPHCIPILPCPCCTPENTLRLWQSRGDRSWSAGWPSPPPRHQGIKAFRMPPGCAAVRPTLSEFPDEFYT